MNFLFRLCISCLLASASFQLHSQVLKDVELSFQIGASAYDFKDGNGMRIDINWDKGLKEKFDLPLLRGVISYKRHNLSWSIEEFGHCYICGYYDLVATDPEAARKTDLTGFLHYRSFRLTTISYGYDVLEWNNFTLSLHLGAAHRHKGDELTTVSVLPSDHPYHPGRPIWEIRYYDEWGLATQAYLRYNIFPWVSLGIKGEYIDFFDRPPNQWGIGAMLGFYIGGKGKRE